MPRKHFEAIAKAIRDAKEIQETPEEVEAVRSVAIILAGEFEDQNERFDYNRFLKACGF